MPGEGIDNSQSSILQHIDAAEKKHKDEKADVADYQQYRNAFIGTVDAFQALENDQEYKINEVPAAKKHFEAGLEQVKKVLVDAAAQGADLSKEITDVSRQSSIDKLNSLSGDVTFNMEKYKNPLKKIAEVELSYDRMGTQFTLARQELTGGTLNLHNIPPSYFEKLSEGLKACKGTSELINTNAGELPEEYVTERREGIAEQQEYATNMLKWQGLHSTIINNKYGDYVEVVMKSMKTGEKEVNFTEDFYKLPDEKQAEILNNLALSDLNVMAAVETATAPEELDSYTAALALFEQGNLDEAQKLLDQFLNTDVIKLNPTKHPTHFANKATYIEQAEGLRDAIKEQKERHKDFFEGQKLANGGDMLDAKKTLQKYLNEHGSEKPGENDAINYAEAAKHLLIQIAKVQIAEIEEKFKLFPAPPTPKREGSGGGMRGDSNKSYEKAKVAYDIHVSMQNQIASLKARAEKGEITDLAAEVAKLDKEMQKIPIGDVLAEEKGKGGLLELARKYREEGKTDLARQYYRRYFADRLKSLSEKKVTMETLRDKYHSNPTFQAEITNKEKEVIEEYKSRFGEQMVYENDASGAYSVGDANQPAGEKKGSGNMIPLWEKMFNANGGSTGIRGRIENEALGNLLPRAAMEAQQLDTSDIPAEDMPAWNEFAEMEGIKARTVGGVETVTIGDEELREVVKEVIVATLITAVSAGVASVAAAAASAALTAAVGAKLGVTGTLMLTTAAHFAVESTVFTLTSSTLNAIRAGEFNINMIGQNFKNEIWHGTAVLGAFKFAGIIGKELSAGSSIVGRAARSGNMASANRMARAGDLAARGAVGAVNLTREMVMMGVISGQLTAQDAAMVLGLKVAHSKRAQQLTERLQGSTARRMDAIKQREAAKTADSKNNELRDSSVKSTADNVKNNDQPQPDAIEANILDVVKNTDSFFENMAKKYSRESRLNSREFFMEFTKEHENAYRSKMAKLMALREGASKLPEEYRKLVDGRIHDEMVRTKEKFEEALRNNNLESVQDAMATPRERDFSHERLNVLAERMAELRANIKELPKEMQDIFEKNLAAKEKELLEESRKEPNEYRNPYDMDTDTGISKEKSMFENSLGSINKEVSEFKETINYAKDNPHVIDYVYSRLNRLPIDLNLLRAFEPVIAQMKEMEPCISTIEKYKDLMQKYPQLDQNKFFENALESMNNFKNLEQSLSSKDTDATSKVREMQRSLELLKDRWSYIKEYDFNSISLFATEIAPSCPKAQEQEITRLFAENVITKKISGNEFGRRVLEFNNAYQQLTNMDCLNTEGREQFAQNSKASLENFLVENIIANNANSKEIIDAIRLEYQRVRDTADVTINVHEDSMLAIFRDGEVKNFQQLDTETKKNRRENAPGYEERRQFVDDNLHHGEEFIVGALSSKNGYDEFIGPAPFYGHGVITLAPNRINQRVVFFEGDSMVARGAVESTIPRWLLRKWNDGASRKMDMDGACLSKALMQIHLRRNNLTHIHAMYVEAHVKGRVGLEDMSRISYGILSNYGSYGTNAKEKQYMAKALQDVLKELRPDAPRLEINSLNLNLAVAEPGGNVPIGAMGQALAEGNIY